MCIAGWGEIEKPRSGHKLLKVGKIDVVDFPPLYAKLNLLEHFD
jgi:hypothetical protein